MRKIGLFLTFLPFLFEAQAQSFEIDSLHKLLQEHPQQDTFRVNRLAELIVNYNVPVDEIAKYAEEAAEISRKINYPVGMGYALLGKAREAYSNGSRDTGMMMQRGADSIANKTGDLPLKFRVLMRYSILYIYNDNKKSLPYALAAEKVAFKSGDKVLLSNSQNLIRQVYYQSGDLNESMDYAIKALRTGEEAACLQCQISAWSGIGNIYTLIGDYDKSNEYFQKALEDAKQLGYSKSALASLANSIGENYRLTGKYAEALKHYKEAHENAPNLISKNVYESNMADVYLRMDSIPQAFNYAFVAIAIAKQLNDAAAESWLFNILSRAYLKKNMPDSALYSAKQGLQLAEDLDALEFIRDNTLALADAYAYKKDYQNAYNFYRQHILYRDSMVNSTIKNRTAVLEHNYQMDKKEAQIALLNQEKKTQQNLLFSALVVLALIGATAFLLLRSNRQKRKANALLKRQKEEIDHKAAELLVQKDNVELLSEIGQKITASLSVETIISTVYDSVNALMDAAVFGIGIYNENLRQLEFPATYEKGAPLPFYANAIDDDNRLGTVCFKEGKEIVINNLDEQYKDYIQQVTTPHAGDQTTAVIYLPLTAKGNKLGVITVQSFKANAYSEYHLFMLRNIATYTAIAIENAESYQTLHQTLSTLQSTQAQLIQSEKMASLGELTAGIAHEIQNPLNFVTNFSEVNTEMIDEATEELANGNLAEAKLILNSVKENSEKINHHGQRADAIVKGMLQHSRKNTGQKEPTDINALCDEYVRLSYHGLRAKDQSFNTALQIHFDDSIGNINIVPQDIGRVLLNLFNNAFYAVQEKKKQSDGRFEPVVTIITKKENGNVIIVVSDNGNGIPQNIRAKIFQPFFTTKPTGLGTGLGLSLSYDIIKAHGGEIKVESKEKEGTAFILYLPVTNQKAG